MIHEDRPRVGHREMAPGPSGRSGEGNVLPRATAWALVLVGLVPMAAVPIAAQDPDPAGLARAVLDSLVAAESIPGLSAAVGLDGEVLWADALGYADVERGRPVTPATLFRVGSVSKSMTSIGLGIIVDRGQLDLDAPVQRYVPAFPEKRWPVTTRQLGGHIAGVRHYRGQEFYSQVYYPDVEAGLTIFSADPLLFEPGTDYSYSSYGWNLLSAAMESAAGTPFLEFMESEVFEPLGMSETLPDVAAEVVPERTTYYTMDDDGGVGVARYVDNSYKWAGGGFLSTPRDLIRLSAALLEPGLVRAETLDVLLTGQRLRNGEETGYGIGWRDGESSRGHRIASHTGGSVGGSTLLWIDLETGLAVAIVANRGDAPVTRSALAERIADAFQPVPAGAN